jgi:hypothetical protein
MNERMKRRRVADEQGAVIVQAAIVMVVLLGFSAFVVDYGVLWVSRQQAQHAADAGAMAGALTRAYDLDDEDMVREAASWLVAENPVWFEAASVDVASVDSCPPGASSDRCVRVEVFRDGTHDSAPLPLLFAPVLSVPSYGVRAMATAQVAVGNATTCLKPWAIPDRWVEHRPVDTTWTSDDEFEKYVESGPSAGSILAPPYDDYASDGSVPGSGLTWVLDLGLPLTLSFANPYASPPIRPGFLLPLVLAGGSSYEDNISGCNGRLAAVDQFVPTGSPGDQSPTTDGFAALLAADPGASWNAGTKSIDGSCAPGCAAISPRLVAVAVFDVDLYQSMRANDDWTACPVAGRCIKVVNIVGFFLEDVVGSDAVGYVARYPGLVSPDNPSLSTASSFLPAVTLVR